MGKTLTLWQILMTTKGYHSDSLYLLIHIIAPKYKQTNHNTTRYVVDFIERFYVPMPTIGLSGVSNVTTMDTAAWYS